MSLTLCLSEGCPMNLCLSEGCPICLYLCLCHSQWISIWFCSLVSVCLSLTKDLAVFIEQYRKHHMRKERNTLPKSLTEIYKGLSHRFQLIPTDPDNIHHCLSNKIHNWLLLTFMVDFRKWLSILFSLLSATETHALSGSEVRKNTQFKIIAMH